MTEREKLEQAIVIQESMRGTIPDDVVDVAIAAIRKQLAELKTVQPVEQRRQITVLFADLSGFTPMAESMDAEDVGQIMSAYFAAVTPAISKYGGVIEKFIGDAVMAVFGLTRAYENDPENGVRAALEMQQALAELNDRMTAEWGFRLAMRIGVNTGPVVAKYLGGAREQDFTIVGDTVNLASRLETAAPVGGVLISHEHLPARAWGVLTCWSKSHSRSRARQVRCVPTSSSKPSRVPSACRREVWRASRRAWSVAMRNC